MHLDLAHAAIVVAALIVANLALKSSRILGDESEKYFNWKRFLVYFVVIFIVNLLWPL
jgi:hypothetical protein